MGLLETLKLPDSTPPPAPPAKPEPGVKGRDAAAFEQAKKLRDGMKAELEKGWNEAVAIAKKLEPEPKKAFIAQLQAADKKRQEARRLDGDPPAQVVLIAGALMGLKQARQAVGQPVHDGTDANTAYKKDGISVEKPTGAPPAPPPPVVATKKPDEAQDPKKKAEIATARAEADRRYKAAYDAHARLTAEQEALTKSLAAEKGAARKQLQDQKAEVDEKVETAEHRRGLAQQDLETLSDPLAKADAINKAIARQKGGDVAESTTVDKREHELKPGEKKTETTTTKVEKGTATVAKTTDSFAYGADGASVGRKVETERTSAEGTSRKSDELKGSVSLDGLKVERNESSEFENRDGKKLAVEREKSLDIGASGVKGSSKKTVTKRDGSSESTTVSGGLERGDGKAAVVSSGSRTSTDASGNETTVSGGKKRGLVAGDDGYGVMAENTAGIAKQSKGGFKTNAKLTYGGNITCLIGDPNPKTRLYPVTLTVQFAASVGAGTGHGKKDAKSQVSVDAKFAAAATMQVVQNLPKEKVQAYVDSLAAAASGSKADATYNELTIIYTGAKQTWDIAKRMYLEGGTQGAVGKAEGDSAEIADEHELSVSAKGNLRAVKAEGSVRRGGKSSTKVTRTNSGGLDVDRQQEESEGASGGLGVDTGLTGMMVKGGYEMKTSIGFLVTIEPADDPTGELLKAFMKCKTPAQQQAFIDANKGKVKLKEMTRGKKEGTSSGVEANVGPADIKLASKGSTSRKTKTDGDGKLLESEVVGEQEAGGSAGIGETLRMSDSRKSTATSRRDGEGNVSLDLAEESKSSNLLSRAGKRIKGMLGLEDKPAEEKKKPTGLIKDVAGSKEEEQFEREIYGVHIGKEDVARIVARAKGNAQEWSQMCWLAVDRKGILEWSALRGQIAAKGTADPGFVTDQLAAFIGVDQGRRMDVLMRLVRPGGDTATGKRSEFPKSIREHAKAYDELVVRGNIADAVAKKAKAEGKEAAGKWGQEQFQRLEKMLAAVRLAEDFRDKATQLEMMSAINDAKSALLKAVRHETGGDDAKAEADATGHDYQRIVLELTRFPEVANPRMAEMKKLLGSRNRLYNDNLKEGLDLIEDLANVFENWKREYGKVEKLGKQLGKSEAEYAKHKPDLTQYMEMRKAAGLSR